MTSKAIKHCRADCIPLVALAKHQKFIRGTAPEVVIRVSHDLGKLVEYYSMAILGYPH
jgi:hypothetical protein